MNSTNNFEIIKYKKLLIISGFIVLFFNFIISPIILNVYKGNVVTKEIIYSIYQLLAIVCCYFSYKLSNSFYENRIIAFITAFVEFGLTWSAYGVGFFVIILCLILVAGDPKE